MKKIFSLVIIAFLILAVGLFTFVAAHGEETFAAAEEIINQKIPCDELTNSQIEILGDYYMEQMHPGELHEIMDERMGGEGSESLRQTHFNMGRAFYCGDHDQLNNGMMNMMMGRGMMGGFYGGGYGGMWLFGWLFMILVLVALILLIVWLIKQIQKPSRR
jgi:hypothetical protein